MGCVKAKSAEAAFLFSSIAVKSLDLCCQRGKLRLLLSPRWDMQSPRECSKETLQLGMRSLGAHLLWEGPSAAPQKPQPLFQPSFHHFF